MKKLLIVAATAGLMTLAACQPTVVNNTTTENVTEANVAIYDNVTETTTTTVDNATPADTNMTDMNSMSGNTN
jgi:protein involved in sex pheromone biosynthesis